jgi:predicted nuclease of predicted toxin-antitoxin system
VKLLVDESLARRVADLLRDAAHDAVHAADRGLLGARDEVVMAAARQEDRVVVTADTDFGTLLALSDMPRPSVLLLRRPGRRVEQRVAAVAAAIAAVEDALEEGALVVVEPERIRVRELPIGGT